MSGDTVIWLHITNHSLLQDIVLTGIEYSGNTLLSYSNFGVGCSSFFVNKRSLQVVFRVSENISGSPKLRDILSEVEE